MRALTAVIVGSDLQLDVIFFSSLKKHLCFKCHMFESFLYGPLLGARSTGWRWHRQTQAGIHSVLQTEPGDTCSTINKDAV